MLKKKQNFSKKKLMKELQADQKEIMKVKVQALDAMKEN